MSDPLRRRTTLVLALAVPLGGCGLLRSIGLLPSPPAPAIPPAAPPPPSDYPLALTLVADDFINPDPTGRASPLRVHIHVDERDPRLGERGFASVFGAGPGGAGAAGASPSAASEPLASLVLAPGARESLMLAPSARARWVTVSGAYREPWSALWTATLRVADEEAPRLVATFGKASVVLAPEPAP